MTSLNKTQYLGQVRELWAIFLFFLALITKFFSHVSVFIKQEERAHKYLPRFQQMTWLWDRWYYVLCRNFQFLHELRFFFIPVVLTTSTPLSGLYNIHTVAFPALNPAPITQTLGWPLAMVCGTVVVRAVHVVPSPPHLPHASSTKPLFGTPSHPIHVELVPLHTPVSLRL